MTSDGWRSRVNQATYVNVTTTTNDFDCDDAIFSRSRGETHQLERAIA